MADLMHPRVANNYAAMGYYPTDDATLRGIGLLVAPSTEAVKCLDPCCGCGSALAQFASHERYPFGQRYGIELDGGRVAQATPRLHKLLHANALEAHVTPQSVDCLFLNPPYGWNLGDKEAGGKRVRLEHQFLQHFFPALRGDGLLIYIVPKASFGEACQKWLLARFDDIGVWLAATDRFDQIVIIARKRKAASAQMDQAQLDQFAAWQTGKEPWPTLPETAAYRYHPAANSKALLMQSKLLDAQGMAALTRECSGLWHDFAANFCRSDNHAAIRPLHDLTEWHTCLLISAGVVSGLVDNGQRCLLIKGRTSKTKIIRRRENDDGNVISEEQRDRFTTVIKAIDMTPDSPHYGSIIQIK